MNAQGEESESAQWLRFAREDLAAAEHLNRSEAPPRAICLLSQQAAEKAIKAAIIAARIRAPRSHDLGHLNGLLLDSLSLDTPGHELDELTQWAVAARYPGDWEEPTSDDAAGALRIARGVVEGATKSVGREA